MELPQTIDWLEDALVVDFETIGADPSTARIVELSILRNDGSCYATFVNPGIPVPFETTRITNITQSDINDAPSSADVIPYLAKRLSGKYFVAHNGIKFDNRVAEAECARFGVSWNPGPVIDTLKIAQRAWYNATDHTVGGLMKMLGIPHGTLHGAEVDTICTLHILSEAIKYMKLGSIEDVIAFQNTKRQFGPLVTFGKYKGLRWEEVPKGYLNYFLTLPDVDPDIMEKIKSILGPATRYTPRSGGFSRPASRTRR